MLKVFAMVIIMVIVAAYALFFSPISKIKNIDLNPQSCISHSAQLDKYQISGQNILLFQPQEFAKNLKNDFSCIDQINIKKHYPSKLSIDIVPQKPVVKIDGQDLMVEKDGLVINSDASLKLPTIFLSSAANAQAGQKITDSLTLFAILLTSELQKTDFIPQNVRIVGESDVAIYNPDGVIALFSSSKSPLNQVDSLQLILARAKIDPTKIAKIDLRFDKPVIANK